ncbi:hypothetical protein TNCV_4140331 [Trichonephila clavipes]|nr:hypothetical protein TNCV_4140331 [Trichonephila clavipes]
MQVESAIAQSLPIGVVIGRGRCQLRRPPRHLKTVQNTRSPISLTILSFGLITRFKNMSIKPTQLSQLMSGHGLKFRGSSYGVNEDSLCERMMHVKSVEAHSPQEDVGKN